MEKLNNLFLLKKNSHNPLIFNGVLWLFSYGLLLLLFADGNPLTIDYYYTIVFIFSLSIPVLIAFYFLIPKYLKKEKYVIFIALLAGLIIAFSSINTLFLNDFINLILPDYYFISYLNTPEVYLVFVVYITLAILLKLGEDWLYFNQIENQTLRLENQQKETQLSSLKAQINPHFLFNSLNVLYALALQDKKETTEAIVQLSDILRYVLYDSNSPETTLKKEIALLNKYLDFQKFRYTNTAKIQFDCTIDNDDFPIYPMLLLPLVENSFKHGIKGDIEKTFINIQLQKTNTEIHFFIENNLSEEIKNDANEYSGLGLKNIQQNLEFIYPNQHSFIITKTEKIFQVSLKIKINEH